MDDVMVMWCVCDFVVNVDGCISLEQLRDNNEPAAKAELEWIQRLPSVKQASCNINISIIITTTYIIAYLFFIIFFKYQSDVLIVAMPSSQRNDNRLAAFHSYFFVTDKNLIHNLSITNCRFQQVYKDNNSANTANLMVSIYANSFYGRCVVQTRRTCRMCIKLPFNFLVSSSTSYCYKSTYQTISKTRTSIQCVALSSHHETIWCWLFAPKKKKYLFY